MGLSMFFTTFFKRMDQKKVGKKAIELLVDAGTFDRVGWSRDALRESIEGMYEQAGRDKKDHASGVLTFFSLLGQTPGQQFEKPPQVAQERTKLEIYRREKELLGFFLTGHPMDAYRPFLERLSCVSFAQFSELSHQAVIRSAFIVEQVDVKIASKTQKKFAILQISDGGESYELPIWSEMYEEKNHLLIENQLLYAILQIDKRDETMKLSCRWMDDLTQANEEMIQACDKAFDRAKVMAGRVFPTKAPSGPKEASKETAAVVYTLNVSITRLSHILQLKEILHSHPGKHPVHLKFSGLKETLYLGDTFSITPSAELERKLKEIPSFILEYTQVN